MGESPGSVEDNEKLAGRAVPTRALDGEEINNLFIYFDPFGSVHLVKWILVLRFTCKSI